MERDDPRRLAREDWLDLARFLDWDFTYVAERDVFPPEMAGTPWLKAEDWADWDEPFHTTYAEYVVAQSEKDQAVYAVRDAVQTRGSMAALPTDWLNALKLHGATLPLAEFAAVVGNLRAVRFGRASAWRMTATFGALDEFRHTQIPLMVMHELLKTDAQFDWAHRFYHSDNWVAIAARHLVDELLLGANPIEFAVATNFVFETGFTNLQFIGLSALARDVGDKMFERMVQSIQTDEARHSQIGPPVLAKVVQHDHAYAQYLLDKWFWRNWHLFAIVTGFSLDYLTPLAHRRQSFKEFMQEWVLEQFIGSIERFGLKKPWYWDEFIDSLDYYHHMTYVSAYTYRATVWFDFVMPGPDEHRWLQEKYPESWPALAPLWERLATAWEEADPGLDFAVHGTAIVAFCDLCQVVLTAGRPDRNTACTHTYDGRKYVFCSAPCRWIFEQESQRYAGHKGVVKRVLDGDAPGNVLALITQYFGLNYSTWGKDAFAGRYPWMACSKSAGEDDDAHASIRVP